jgi:hypothetical protein
MDLASVLLNVVMPHVRPVMVVMLTNVLLVEELKLYLVMVVKTVVLNSNTMMDLTIVQNVTILAKTQDMDVMEHLKQIAVIQVVKPVLVEVTLTA